MSTYTSMRCALGVLLLQLLACGLATDQPYVIVASEHGLAALELRRYVFHATGHAPALVSDCAAIATGACALHLAVDPTVAHYELLPAPAGGLAACPQAVVSLRGRDAVHLRYAVTAFAELQGIQFGLHADIYPSARRRELVLPSSHVRASPVFTTRGLQVGLYQFK